MTASAILANFAGLYPKRGFVHPNDSSWNVVGPTGPQKPSQQVYLALDAMVSEAPEYQATPTQSPVEDATTISDHVCLKPVKLTVRGIVTDTPIGIRALASSFSGKGSPSKKAYDFLVRLWKERVPFDFVGGFDLYKTMVLTSFQPVNSAEHGDSLQFSCTMEQIIVVSTQKITTIRAGGKKSRGAQALSATPAQLNEPVDTAGNMLDGGFMNPASTRTAQIGGGGAEKVFGTAIDLLGKRV
jgi:hypothetical protein